MNDVIEFKQNKSIGTSFQQNKRVGTTFQYFAFAQY